MTKFKVGDRVNVYWNDSPVGKAKIIHIWINSCDLEIADLIMDSGKKHHCHTDILKKLRPKKKVFEVGDRVIIGEGSNYTGCIGYLVREIQNLGWEVILDDGVPEVNIIFDYDLLKKLKKAKPMLKVGDRVRIKDKEPKNLWKGKIVKISETGIFEIKKDNGGSLFVSDRDSLVRLGNGKKCEKKIEWFFDLENVGQTIDEFKEKVDIFEELKKENKHLKSCIRECGEDMTKLVEEKSDLESLVDHLKEVTDDATKVANIYEKDFFLVKKENEELRDKIDKLNYQLRGLSVVKSIFNKEDKKKPTLDLTKPVQTRSGLKARIICVDRNTRFCIVALITDESREELIHKFTSDGLLNGTGGKQHPFDLINVPEEK